VILEFWHLEGVDRGRSTTLRGPRVAIGTEPGCELCLAAAPGVLPYHAEVTVDGPDAYLRAGGTVELNGQPVGEAKLRDGDLLVVGEVRLRVRLVREEKDKDDFAAALLARPAPAELPLSPSRLFHGRVGGAVTLLFLTILLGGAYLAARPGARGPDRVQQSLMAERSRQDALRAEQQRTYTSHLRKLSDEVDGLERRMADRADVDKKMGDVQRAVAEMENEVLSRVNTEVERTLGSSPELRAARDAVRRMESADTAAGRIIETYGGSVCLVQGSYGFGKMKDGKWQFLREATPELLEGMKMGDRVPLMLEGDGPIFRVEYTGTGFLVDRKGIVLTNRHIAQPWWKNDAATPLVRDGYEPRFLQLRAYFPGHKKAIDFDRKRTKLSEEADLAALYFKPEGKLPPPFALAVPARIVPGHRVLLLGYPSGLDALLARTENRFDDGLLDGDDLDSFGVMEALAERGLVRPLPTQGHVSDVLPDKVLFDAPTAVGGSGGPLVDMQGRVVAINYGILKAFRGANFGVPVLYAARLLER